MIFSIGYGNTKPSVFIDALAKCGIRVLFDVRSSPFSQRNPLFSRYQLEPILKARGVEYRWMKALGGRVEGKNDEYYTAIEEIKSTGYQKNVVLMCAESVPTKCHRVLKLGEDIHGMIHLYQDTTWSEYLERYNAEMCKKSGQLQFAI